MAELLAALSNSLPVMAILMVMPHILDGLKAKKQKWLSFDTVLHRLSLSLSLSLDFHSNWMAHGCWLCLSQFLS